MNIKKVEEGKRFFRRTKLLGVLEDFEAMDAEVAEVLFGEKEYANASSAYAALNASVKRFGKASTITVKQLGGKVYLVKECKTKVTI